MPVSHEKYVEILKKLGGTPYLRSSIKKVAGKSFYKSQVSSEEVRHTTEKAVGEGVTKSFHGHEAREKLWKFRHENLELKKEAPHEEKRELIRERFEQIRKTPEESHTKSEQPPTSKSVSAPPSPKKPSKPPPDIAI